MRLTAEMFLHAGVPYANLRLMFPPFPVAVVGDLLACHSLLITRIMLSVIDPNATCTTGQSP